MQPNDGIILRDKAQHVKKKKKKKNFYLCVYTRLHNKQNENEIFYTIKLESAYRCRKTELYRVKYL